MAAKSMTRHGESRIVREMEASENRARRSLVALLFALLPACERPCIPSTESVLEAAIAAHGGRERLAQLDNLRVVSSGLFKQRIPFKRILLFRAPSTWAMDLQA